MKRRKRTMRARQSRQNLRYSGKEYTRRLMDGHDAVFHHAARMDKVVFSQLCLILQWPNLEGEKLEDGRPINVEQQVLMFLQWVGSNASNHSETSKSLLREFCFKSIMCFHNFSLLVLSI
ncbi:hypothetical protein M427DRAFT_447865 [Gonapodya prolifera JEL478]|uniref:DUF8040 domain-containing protein n=1 Tax=Gonapodya prolifera (strain JEL478) TaxID=1344416 RepID=A0A139A2X3_GONPJ|nr:hypothetical protein M427DRAFT_447865 [Gonapodya prolifera JEL478]|eukprot:KXS11137.1 hypothetical protein M427DRAFT_447865 [Gonapodya prolifera JEL478]